MALIAMAVHDLDGAGRTSLTSRTLESLQTQVDFKRHRLFVIDNGSCDDTKYLLETSRNFMGFHLITLPANIGTAKAINLAWKNRKPGELCVKMDNDVVVHHVDWPDRMEEAVRRQPKLGIVGLKRKDCEESPNASHPWYRSSLTMLPHLSGQPWLVVEQVNHVMGTCQGYNPALLDKIGYLYQMGGLYGFDDALASVRAQIAGFWTVFLHGIEIDHIDPGGTPYTQWKQDYAGTLMAKFNQIKQEFESGKRPIYCPAD